MSAPKRIRLRRTAGWRKPEGAIVCRRPTKYGNPYRLKPGMQHTIIDQWGNEFSCAPGEWRGVAVRKFREDIANGRMPYTVEDLQTELGGHDLCCTCSLDQPCHVDVLLELANSPTALEAS